jgi:DNA-binding transcriptional regulator YdaS (Cro superfamily)
MQAIERAINIAGGPAKVAAALGVSTQAVCFWRDGARSFPAQHCAPLESASGQAVRRWDLRPNDWHLIWPELVGAEGAPPIPTDEARDGE